LDGGERAVPHGGDKVGGVDRGDVAGFAVQKALDKATSDLLGRFGSGDHIGAQPPRIGYFGLVSAELLGDFQWREECAPCAGMIGTMLMP
jgi:hypothetical protein